MVSNRGGILSPVLFTIYMDEMFQRLKDSGLGCFIGNIFMGGLGYADDAVLLAPTLSSMKEMLNICDAFGKKYNIEKYQFLHFPGSNGKSPAGLWHNDIHVYIKCVQVAVHLGHIIGVNTKVKVIDQAINTFNVALYSILNTFQHANVNVKYKLFKSFCMPLYGSVLWDFESREILQFYTEWRKAIRRLFNLSNRTHSRYLHLICDDSPINVQLYKRFNKFIKTVLNSDNNCVKLAGRMAVCGSQSNVSKNINFIAKELNCTQELVSEKPVRFKNRSDIYEHSQTNVNDKVVCGNIKDLICIKESNHTKFSYEEITHMIEYLCTC